MVARGDVWLCALDPTVGREIQKTRPCLIISPDEMNRVLTTAIVAPLTSGSHPAGFRTPVSFKGRDGLILFDQMRTVDRKRLIKRLGRIDADTFASVLAVLAEMFRE